MADSSIFDNGIDITEGTFYDIFGRGSIYLASRIYLDVINRDYFKQKEKDKEERRSKMSWLERSNEDIRDFSKYNANQIR